MPELLNRPYAPRGLLVPGRTPDERPARRSLLEQVARLEEELSQLFCSTWPRTSGLEAVGPPNRPFGGGRRPPPNGFEWEVRSRGGPRLLSLAELEGLRDRLAGRVSEARRALSDRTYVEEQNRRLIEEMLLEPERHKWVRVANEDIGEPGCKNWHVRPRWGVLGMLMSWWRVVVSSGCPLARAGDAGRPRDDCRVEESASDQGEVFVSGHRDPQRTGPPLDVAPEVDLSRQRRCGRPGPANGRGRAPAGGAAPLRPGHRHR